MPRIFQVYIFKVFVLSYNLIILNMCSVYYLNNSLHNCFSGIKKLYSVEQNFYIRTTVF
jgi:hypothetical protein